MVQTERLTGETGLDRAAELLKAGELAALPTETVYGLAGNALDAAAVERIYAVKGRPEGKALSILVDGPAALDRYCVRVPPAARRLAERFWPGPLTLVLPSKKLEAPALRAGGETIGLRCPDHPLTLALLRRCDFPLAAPSANPSGADSPKTAEAVLKYFDGRIAAVLDGGPCTLGRESTLLDLSAAPYRILREGALPQEKLLEALEEGLVLIGLTGGSGCGKTTALETLKNRGAMILDADAVYHRLTAEDPALREELTERFGAVYTVEQGKNILNRKKLAALVFRDPAALEDLNRITHKYVNRELHRLLREHALAGGWLAAVDAVALPSSELFRQTFRNVAVAAPLEDRIRRISLRDGISPEAARQRVSAQMPEEEYAKLCDAVLRNDGDRAAFEAECVEFFDRLLGDSGTHGPHDKTVSTDYA